MCMVWVKHLTSGCRLRSVLQGACRKVRQPMLHAGGVCVSADSRESLSWLCHPLVMCGHDTAATCMPVEVTSCVSV